MQQAWGLRPTIYATMPSLTAAHAKDLGYIQFHPGNEFVYFIKVIHMFGHMSPTGEGGYCAFCHGDPVDEREEPDSNIHHWFQHSTPDKHGFVICPLCKGRK